MTTQQISIAGVRFNYVKELPQETLDLLIKSVIAFEGNRSEWNEFEKVNSLLGSPFASGHFGNVYALGEDYILKIEKPEHKGDYVTRDGKILEDLQGIPMIPQIYAYDENNDYMVIQRIKGQTCGGYSRDPEFELPADFDIEWTKAMIKNTAKQIEERGWQIADAHAGNCMIDHEGNFWIVDVGLFDNLKELENGKRPFGRSTLEAIRSLGAVMQGVQKKKNREIAEMEARIMKDEIARVVQRDFDHLNKAFAQVGKKFAEVDFQAFARNMAEVLKNQARDPHKPFTMITPAIRVKPAENPLYNYGNCMVCWNYKHECTCDYYETYLSF
jgi:hypothetical protein